MSLPLDFVFRKYSRIGKEYRNTHTHKYVVKERTKNPKRKEKKTNKNYSKIIKHLWRAKTYKERVYPTHTQTCILSYTVCYSEITHTHEQL